jgi:hypothetical protein
VGYLGDLRLLVLWAFVLHIGTTLERGQRVSYAVSPRLLPQPLHGLAFLYARESTSTMDTEHEPVDWDDFLDEGQAEFGAAELPNPDIAAVNPGTQTPAWIAHLRDTAGFNPNNNNHKAAISRRTRLADAGDLPVRVHRALKHLRDNEDLDLATILYCVTGCRDTASDKFFSGQVFEMTSSPSFPRVLEHLESHESRNKKKRSPPLLPMRDFAMACFQRTVDREISALKPIMKMDPRDVSEETLVAIDMDEMKAATKTKAPSLWAFLMHISATRVQRERNKFKSPEGVSDFCVSSLRSRVYVCNLSLSSCFFAWPCSIAHPAMESSRS